MKTTILNQRAERDELMSRPYQQRHTKYNTDELLQNPLIKLITGPRRVGKSVFALLMLQGKNFAYLNFDETSYLINGMKIWSCRPLKMYIPVTISFCLTEFRIFPTGIYG